ncbi:hypothetical protein DOY81_012802 [Sarcophaga bullata]|nr:hypothetical protein DOY81_012802 [Sarcophaga bullata]
MEDSFYIWRRNAKSFTWPIVGRTIQGVDNCNNNNPNKNNNNSNSNSASLSSSSSSSIISSSNFGISLTNSADKSFDKKIKAEGGLSHPNQLVNKVSAETASVHISGSGNINPGDVEQHQAVVGAVVSAKKKSKRRRNQALCKGKSIQSVRKLSAVGNTSNSVGSNKYHHYSHHRNTSPAWDTDFKGCWEMGPDLIKEFLNRQNSNKRNRSDSNSMDQEEQIERKTSNEMSSKHGKPVMKRYIDLSFCCDDDDDDYNTQQLYSEEGVDYVDTDYDDNTLTSISELAMDSMNPKRLYQREGHLQNLVVGSVLVGNTDSDNTLDEASDSVDPIDFQQFKAKFNSSVEALWKDAESSNSMNIQPAMTQTVTENSLKINNSDSGTGISSNFYATTSLNALAPFKKDLWNFWSNYNQQQHYDQKLGNKLSTTASTSSMMATRLEDSSASSGAGADIANSSDYFSMPSNLDDFDKSVGGVRRTNDATASLDAHTPSINVFLQNSIWSTSGDCVDAIGTSSTADTDESFLIKVWHSNKKLSQLDVGHAISGEKMPTTLTSPTDGGGELDYIKSKESSILNNPNLGANLQFPPYQNLKWSEGINAGPSCNSLHSNTNIPNSSTLRDENNYGNFRSAANISGATWEAPAYGQNAQPDLKSWCASNPMSLTEMYGSDVCDSIVNQPSSEDSEENPVDVNIGPAVTLPNHSVSSSGFVAYARVKQCGIVKPQTKPLQSSNALRLPKDFFRSGEEENLLTSERTHFRPIENFVDGHTFEISNALDSVDFERTESGLLYYDSEEYLEYTRNDIYMADEEVSTSSTNLLKYGKKPSEEKSDMFIIKFRVKRSEEIACQTEEKDFELAAAKMTEIPTTATLSDPTYFSQGEVNNMFHNTFSLSRQANNEAIMAAVTKAVAAAAKAAAENHLNSGYFSWLHPTHAVAVCHHFENRTFRE